MTNRWWIYQRERFPLFAHGLLIFVFSYSSIGYSILLHKPRGVPSLGESLVAFSVSFFLFMQLRIADEFKDQNEDSSFRPYRPVPRGLVSLKELKIIGIISIFLQLIITLFYFPKLFFILAILWIYLMLMTKEFFMPGWLKAHPIIYMWTHMLIMPLLALYCTAVDWFQFRTSPDTDLLFFLAASFFGGMILEIGRKIRPPESEEEGVETYTALWGIRNTIFVWIFTAFILTILSCIAAIKIDFVIPVALSLTVLLIFSIYICYGFIKTPGVRLAGLMDKISGLWVLFVYIMLGILPLYI